MTANAWKAVIALTCLLCVTILLALGTVPAAVGFPIITAIAFYAIGNGIAAAQGKHSEPIIKPRSTYTGPAPVKPSKRTEKP